MTNVALEAIGLRKSFRRRTVVDDVSFSVAPGEIVGLLGPNGAGKSTSFNMVAGLVPADHGRVLLGDRDLGGMPLHARARHGLGYLPQESTVFRGLSVHDNLLAVLEAHGVKGEAARSRAQELLGDFKLEQVATSLGSELSGGERRRVEMARTLIPSPAAILLDEPFAGIDPIAVREIRGFISEMSGRGIGILVTDHNVRETLRLCDRAYLIHAGKIAFEGTPEAIVGNEEARKTYLGEDFSL